MENVFLFSVEADPRTILTGGSVTTDIQINGHDYMTQEEWKVFQKSVSTCVECVINALTRKVIESQDRGIDE